MPLNQNSKILKIRRELLSKSEKFEKITQIAETTYQMLPLWVHIYTPSALQLGGPYLSLTVAILAKGMCFLDLRVKAFVHVIV
jgi:hypothetical protein